MDQVKIGRFIAAERKEKKYTQKQLAETLGISDKAVSKWETGRGFPDISLLLPLCNTLQISVNELLSGERLAETNYKQKAEENMMNLVQERQENKKKIILSAMVAVLVIIAALPLFLVSGMLELGTGIRAGLIGTGFFVIATGIVIACILDRDAGAFECPVCQNRFVPEMGAYVMAAHTITKRRLKCPKCGKKSYCRKVLSKSNTP